MAVRGRKEKPIDRDESPWHAFVDDLRKLRGEETTLADIGAKIGYSASYLSRMLNPGNDNITERFVRAYAEACGADPDEWARRRREALGEPEPPEPPTVPRPRLSPEETADTLEPLPIKPRVSQRRVAIIASAVGGVLAVLAGTVVTTMLGGPDRPPNVVITPTDECRSSWAGTSQKSVLVMPCIKHDDHGIAIYAKIKSIKRGGRAEEVTVWLWLMKHDRHLVERHAAHLTRNEASLRRCRIRLANADQIATCGPFIVPPPAEKGVYTTSSSVRSLDATYPPGWNDPTFTGTQGGLLTWTPTRS
ncbi:hypothetical protein Arub01_43720 [Actinomadura rubrobrunea]|uniref:Helix-turn-helix domain-containing protein n=2 Tax=Actinomadura rubrobrunea TaxID=115335 RepID=A0A9W6Q0B6_9ACTN|nr:hypothetical protein Arub01_43720 [Actinomadura rubrobrunea]